MRAILTAVLCLSLVSAAQANWSYDFSSMPPAPFITASVPASGSFSATASGGILRMADTKAPAAGGAGFGVAGNVLDSLADVRVCALLNPANEAAVNTTGVLARGTLATNTTYTAGFSFATGVLSITKLVNGSTVMGDISAAPTQGSQTPLTGTSRSYYLQLDVLGSSPAVLTAKLFDAPGGTELLHVNLSDAAPLLSGTAGLFASTVNNSTALNDTFDNASAVPEPGTMVLCAAVVGLVARRRRK